MKRYWTVRFGEQTHRIELDHSWASGSKEVLVDGKPLPEATSSGGFDLGGHYEFHIGEHRLALVVRYRIFGFKYELYANGKPIAEDAVQEWSGREGAQPYRVRMLVLTTSYLLSFAATFYCGLSFMWPLVGSVVVWGLASRFSGPRLRHVVPALAVNIGYLFWLAWEMFPRGLLFLADPALLLAGSLWLVLVPSAPALITFLIYHLLSFGFVFWQIPQVELGSPAFRELVMHVVLHSLAIATLVYGLREIKAARRSQISKARAA